MESTRNKQPHKVLLYPSNFPEETIEEDIAFLNREKLNLQLLRREDGFFASFEWIIPTALGAYILNPYFDSFLSEAGKDHYTLLKAALKKMMNRGKLFESSLLAATQSINKLSRNYTQFLTVSLEFQTKDDRRIKLLFDNRLEVEDWNNAVEQLLELLSENYERYPNDKLTYEINQLNTKAHRIIYVPITPETNALEFNDDLKMIQKSQ